MHKHNLLEPTDDERSAYTEVIRSGKGSFEQTGRAQILLKAELNGPGWTNLRIAEAFDCKADCGGRSSQAPSSGGFEVALVCGRTVLQRVFDDRADVDKHRAGWIDSGSVIYSDGMAAYEKVSNEAGCEHRKCQSRIGSRSEQHERWGVLSLAPVNAHKHNLKTLVNRQARGVSTRCLADYPRWHEHQNSVCLRDAGVLFAAQDTNSTSNGIEPNVICEHQVLALRLGDHIAEFSRRVDPKLYRLFDILQRLFLAITMSHMQPGSSGTSPTKVRPSLLQ